MLHGVHVMSLVRLHCVLYDPTPQSAIAEHGAQSVPFA